jgi:hypothetical protein
MNRILLAFTLAFSIGIQAQNNTIAAGEKLIFTASYNMSGLLTDLAQVTMETTDVKTSKATLLRLRFKIQTYYKWDNFFKINDVYETYVNPKTLEPYLHNREINEGSYYKKMKYTYDKKFDKVRSVKTKRRKDGTFWKENKDLSIGAKTNDIVTTIYHIRNLDIHKAAIGSSDNFTILFDNEETPVKITLLAKETIATKIGDKVCYKLSFSLTNNDIFSGENNNLLWLTADANKIPVYAKFKVPVGNGELKIQSATGLKH